MIGRPMLRVKILGSTPESWLGRPMKEIPEGDLWRWQAVTRAARADYSRFEG